MTETKTDFNQIMQPRKWDYEITNHSNFNLKCYLSMKSIPRFDLSKEAFGLGNV